MPPPKKDYIGKDIYSYSFVFETLAANGTGTDSVTIENDSDFLWMKATYYANVDETSAVTEESRVVPLVNFNWKDTSSGRTIFNVPTPVPSFWGRGEIPFILPQSKLIYAKSTLTIDVTNLHDTEAYRLTLTMIGTKLFIR